MKKNTEINNLNAQRNANNTFSNFLSGYNDPNQNFLSYNYDTKTGALSPDSQGMMQGLNLSKLLTGRTIGEIGQEAKSISDQYKQMANQAPVSGDITIKGSQDAIARSNAKAGLSGIDVTAQNIQQKQNADFGAQVANRTEQRQALDAFAKNINAVAGTTTQQMYGQQALAVGKTPSIIPNYSSGGLTVICTELYRQGYMSESIKRADEAYGLAIMANKPEIYIGYRFLADPIVKLMKKSKVFTALVAIPGMAWARNMAGDKNLLGKLISVIGEPICSLIGKVITYGKQISPSCQKSI